IWFYAVRGFWSSIWPDNNAWLMLVSCLWWCALMFLQVMCSFLVLFWILLLNDPYGLSLNTH
ncbi:MAG TPA: hypothetical protein VF598_03730, partial [Hymenobacter sp.]